MDMDMDTAIQRGYIDYSDNSIIDTTKIQVHNLDSQYQQRQDMKDSDVLQE